MKGLGNSNGLFSAFLVAATCLIKMFFCSRSHENDGVSEAEGDGA